MIIKVLAIFFSALLLLQPVKAQETHHPTRILITFHDESEVFEVLRNHSLQNTEEHAFKRSTDVKKIKDFLIDNDLTSLEKLIPAKMQSDKAKAHGRVPQQSDKIYIAEVDDAELLSSTVKKLRESPQIKIAEPDFIGHGSGILVHLEPVTFYNAGTVDDDYFNSQWGLYNTGQTVGGIPGVPGEDINIIPAWEITTGSSDVVVAILDSGIPGSNIDFKDRVLDGYNFVSGLPGAVDDHGHGTSVASIALASGNNGNLIAGVNWKAQILPGKILDHQNSGFYSWWTSAIYWAVEEGARVINISAGGSGYSQTLKDAVDFALNSEVMVVACMMNADNEVPFYPAAFDGVFSVGAINNIGERAAPFAWGGGSNYGNHIELMAPGNLIASLVHNNASAVSYWSGTSQATPMVLGVIALMLSLNPDLSNSEIEEILISTARGDGNWNKYTGWGVLDAFAALDKVQKNYTSAEQQENPSQIKLYQNYPNPFNPLTHIQFKVEKSAKASLYIYDVLGRPVMTFAEGKIYSPGIHTITVNAAKLSSGIYFYTLTTNDESTTKMMSLIK